MLYEISIDNLGHRILHVAGELAKKRNMRFKQLKQGQDTSVLQLEASNEDHLKEFVETLETDRNLKVVSILAEDGSYLTRQTTSTIWVKKSRPGGSNLELAPIS